MSLMKRRMEDPLQKYTKNFVMKQITSICTSFAFVGMHTRWIL